MTGALQKRARSIDDLPPIEAAAAYLLKGETPRPELLEFLRLVVKEAASATEATLRSPTRSETRKLLIKVRELARALNETLRHPALAPFHSTLTQERRRLGEIIPPLESSRLEAVVEAAEFSLENVPAGGGATRLSDVVGQPRPAMLIAVGVVVVWAALHGRRPSARNSRAIEACYHLGMASGDNTEDRNKWSEHIASVRSGKLTNEPASTRLLVARLAIGSLIDESGLGGAIGMKKRPIPPEFEEIPRR